MIKKFEMERYMSEDGKRENRTKDSFNYILLASDDYQ